jgi:DNA-binding NarL/FixJ family response regulator
MAIKHLRFVIADDHQIVRDGLKQTLLSPRLMPMLELELVAEASNGFETLAAVKQHKPDLLLLDISMPLASGSEVILEVKRWSPETRIVVYTAVTSAGVLAGLVNAGVDGLFAKGADTSELYQKLPLIAQGARYVSPVLRSIIDGGAATPPLSPRERQTLNMIIAGKSNREIAEVIGISTKTVEKHRTSLMTKLRVHSVAELLAYALREGLIEAHNHLYP